jgi:hypothetical protein
MKPITKRFFIGIFGWFILISFSAWAQEKSLSEPPHIFLNQQETTLIWVENGVKKQVKDRISQGQTTQKLLGFNPYPHFAYTQSGAYHAQEEFVGVQKFVALSDIHGQYQTLTHFLQTYGVIDEQKQWIFGEGHLVILGDIFDRGPQVTEALWLIFRLEMQALAAGGRVHYLAGNHEGMILYNDLRYVHNKYPQLAELMGIPLQKWFNQQSLLGQWLRKRPVMISINDLLFVHAGLSPAFLAEKYSIKEVNDTFRLRIFPLDTLISIDEERVEMLRFSQGPLWYRGYFNSEEDPTPIAEAALKQYQKQHIVVGHTSASQVRTLLNDQVIAIDASLQKGENGEVLIYENQQLWKGDREGNKKRLFFF